MMNYMLFCFFVAVGIYSCTNASKSDVNIDELLKMDSMVSLYPALHSFTSFELYTKAINGVAVCDSLTYKCKEGENHYSMVLDSIGVSVGGFDSLVTKIDATGFIKFYRYGDYSVWVENGAFGDVYGYLINHNPAIDEVKSFELDERYHIGVGKEVRKNVYYFSSYFD